MSFEEPVFTDVAKEFAEKMIHGMVDHFLELGYITGIHKFSKNENGLIYRRCKRVGEDHIFAEVDELSPDVPEQVFRIIYRAHERDKWYKVEVRIDYHFHVLGVKVESPSHTAFEIATSMHRVLTNIRCGFHWNGERRNITQISELRDCCAI
ncbi:hypothetical protein [Pseudomonas phage D6]|nr:hypothetical protein [Pseudomonas phage D6]